MEYDNETLTTLTQNVAKLCGAEFCPGVTAALNPNLEKPDQSKIQMLMIIFLAMMILASILISVAVDGLKRYEMGRKGSGSELSGFRLLLVTFKQFMQVKQILLLPITMFIGAEQAFMAVDFTSVREHFPHSFVIIENLCCSSLVCCNFLPVEKIAFENRFDETKIHRLEKSIYRLSDADIIKNNKNFTLGIYRMRLGHSTYWIRHDLFWIGKHNCGSIGKCRG